MHEIEHVHGGARLPEAFDAPDALLQAGRIPGEIHVDQRAEGLQVQALAGGVGGNHDADVVIGDHPLELLADDADRLPLAIESAAIGPGIQPDGLGRMLGSQGVGDPAGGVVILAEDDAAEIQPTLLVEVVADGAQLRIIAHAGQGGEQRFERGALRVGLHGQLFLAIFGLFGDRSPRQEFGCGVDPGHDAGTDALLHQVLHEAAALAAFGQNSAEFQGLGVGPIEIRHGAQGDVLEQGVEAMRILHQPLLRMDIDGDLVQQAALF